MGRQCRPYVNGTFRSPPLVDDPVSFIADHYHTVVRVQVDSTKLVHAGLLCVKSVGLHPDSTPAVRPERRGGLLYYFLKHPAFVARPFPPGGKPCHTCCHRICASPMLPLHTP